MRFVSIPRTASSSCTASSIAPSASAIGKDGKAAPEIIRQLSKQFPAPTRSRKQSSGCSSAATSSADLARVHGAVDGYWASLGLPPEIAEENLRNCRVRVESIDVKGASELSAALGKLGVQITKRSPGPHHHAGERLSRAPARRTERRARRRQDALAAGTAVRRVSAGGTRVQAGRERLLDLPVRSHDPQPRDQGISRPRSGAGGRHIAAGQQTRVGQDAQSILRPSKSRRRSPPDFAPICAITSQAST